MGKLEDWGLPGPTYDIEKMADFIMDLDKRLRLIEAHLGFQKFEAEESCQKHITTKR